MIVLCWIRNVLAVLLLGFFVKERNRVVLQERLDRVLWNDKAILLFPEVKVLNLTRTCSDHHPLAFALK